MASRVYHAKLPELEINQIGHGGDFAASHTTNLQMQALRSLKAKLTLIMFGANEEMNAMSGHMDYSALFRQGIKVRAQNAKKDGGKCVVATHPPIFSIWHAANPQWRKIQSSYGVIARDTARRYGCAFLTVWEDLWSPYTSQRQGFTLDGIHPTLRGYHLMSSRLTHWLAVHRSWWLHSNA
jgi:lysophospholipase L1-like esterase